MNGVNQDRISSLPIQKLNKVSGSILDLKSLLKAHEEIIYIKELTRNMTPKKMKKKV